VQGAAAADDRVSFFTTMHVLCATYHALPSDILNEDAYMIHGLVLAAKAFTEKEKLESKKQQQQIRSRGKH